VVRAFWGQNETALEPDRPENSKHKVAKKQEIKGSGKATAHEQAKRKVRVLPKRVSWICELHSTVTQLETQKRQAGKNYQAKLYPISRKLISVCLILKSKATFSGLMQMFYNEAEEDYTSTNTHILIC